MNYEARSLAAARSAPNQRAHLDVPRLGTVPRTVTKPLAKPDAPPGHPPYSLQLYATTDVLSNLSPYFDRETRKLSLTVTRNTYGCGKLYIAIGMHVLWCHVRGPRLRPAGPRPERLSRGLRRPD